tara:strand:+ start:277 stop:438 length:162 start_codon:yes stop_codon:yes gene_type:complete
MTNKYQVYIWFPHIGRYGEHKLVRTFDNLKDAKNRVKLNLDNNLTSHYKVIKK